jgi:Transcriptional regulator/sugar kinase
LTKTLLVENVVIEHDVNAAALAEIKQAPENSSLYFLYIGDGVGGSYLESGKLNLGHDLMAGEVGQTLVGIPIYPDILENVVSKYAIERFIRTKGLPYRLDEIIMRFRAGDNRFSEHLNYVLSVLNVAVYNLIWQYNPTYIVIKSPSRPYQDLIVERASTFFAEKQRYSEANIVKRITTRIVPSFIENNSALEGLFYLVKESLVGSLLNTNDANRL